MNGFRNLTIAVLAASLGVAVAPAQAADGCAVLPRSGYR